MRKHGVGKATNVWYWSRTVMVDIFLIYKLANKVKITINVPVVFMARYVMVLRSATALGGALELHWHLNFCGPKWHSLRSCHFRAQKVSIFRAHP